MDWPWKNSRGEGSVLDTINYYFYLLGFERKADIGLLYCGMRGMAMRTCVRGVGVKGFCE